MTYVLFNIAMKMYLVDDETGEISEDLQKAMILMGEEVVDEMKKIFDKFIALQIERKDTDEPTKISLVQV